MALSIRNPEVEILARDLAARSGSGMTDEILEALRERKDRVDKESEFRFKRIFAMAERCTDLPVLDGRTPDQILGFSDSGAF